MINIILCGGQGTRLWPISRQSMPKQFIPLFNRVSLFQKTVERNAPVCEKFYFVINDNHKFLAFEQLEALKCQNTQFLIEPMGRNTAPAIALACLNLNPDDVVLVTPADHLITHISDYTHAVQIAEAEAKKGHIVTIGIKPSGPQTGFGYIECAAGNAESASFEVKTFHEKPSLAQAINYIAADCYFWNAGIFCFKVETFLHELAKFEPDLYEACLNAHKHAQAIDEKTQTIQAEWMAAIADKSIDYAVLEKSDKIKMVKAQFGWTDLGSFDALDEALPKTTDGNTENSFHINVDSRNNLILGTHRLIATVDIHDCLIVDTPDALLVAKKGSSQKVKEVVSALQSRHSSLTADHTTMYRPWGSYTTLEDHDGYKIKRIEVKPGKRLSLQRHWHRSEHWIVVSGTATVTVGEDTFLVRPNESTYIKMGEVHRLSNEGKIPVVLIEAQVGEYTGEDDIERLSDDFKRV